MAIVKSFNGARISRPGAYSTFKVDNSSGAQLGSNDTLFIVGESSKGAPGSSDGIQIFAAEEMSALVAKYGSGPLVDCAIASISPSPDSSIGGAGRIMIYKTNASTQASAEIDSGINPLFNVTDSSWGTSGNQLSVIIANGDSGSQKTISIAQLGGTTENLGENTATPILSIQYTGNGTAASMTISGVSQAVLALTTSLTGQTDSSVNLSIMLANYTIKQLVDYINAQPGYTASLLSVPNSARKSNQLDPIASTSILTSKQLFRLQGELLDILNSSARVQATLASTPVTGIPSNSSGIPLSGGAQGASTNSDFSNGFAKSLSETYNVLVPCISRDASDDIADANQGFTDASSTYTIAAVVAAQVTHLQLRGQTKNRLEAQGMAGFRNASKATCFAFSANQGSELEQMFMQDILTLDAGGNLVYKHPHVMACKAAGIRLGTAIGEPLTHKFLNVQAIGHFINPLTGLESGDFNPGLDYDEAISNGMTFAEKAQGGFRIVVDNTTYGADDSFLFNRGSVVEAVQYVSQTIRNSVELQFVGKKISNGAASSIKSYVRNVLRQLNAPDVNIITSSQGAPEGFFDDSSFVVTISGDTASVQVKIVPVQGLDYAFITLTIENISQSA
jgi:hypothetical protein